MIELIFDGEEAVEIELFLRSIDAESFQKSKYKYEGDRLVIHLAESEMALFWKEISSLDSGVSEDTLDMLSTVLEKKAEQEGAVRHGPLHQELLDAAKAALDALPLHETQIRERLSAAIQEAEHVA